MNLSIGKRTRLHRLMYEHGPANGTLMMLPIDQGLEHGPIDFFDNPAAIDTDWIYRLAVEGNFSGIALHIGLAEKYQKAVCRAAFRCCSRSTARPTFRPTTRRSARSRRRSKMRSVSAPTRSATRSTSAARRKSVDIAQCNEVRRECDRYGMPLVIWAYPRGSAVKAKGGIDSLYAVDYAARVACEMGADVVKLNEPVWKADDAAKLPKPYNTLQFDDVEGLAQGRQIGRPHARARLGRQQDGRRRDRCTKRTSRWQPAASG